MLSKIIEKGYYTFRESFDTWEDAVKASCEPLIKDGAVEPCYAEEIIDCINEYGPYIVIAPMIALPHSQENAKGVHKTAVSFMKVQEAVQFSKDDREKDAKLFFTIASVNHDEHLQNLTQLANMLSNEEVVNDLIKINSLEGLKSIALKYKL